MLRQGSRRQLGLGGSVRCDYPAGQGRHIQPSAVSHRTKNHERLGRRTISSRTAWWTVEGPLIAVWSILEPCVIRSACNVIMSVSNRQAATWFHVFTVSDISRVKYTLTPLYLHDDVDLFGEKSRVVISIHTGNLMFNPRPGIEILVLR